MKQLVTPIIALMFFVPSILVYASSGQHGQQGPEFTAAFMTDTSNVVAKWSCEESSGSAVYDSSGNENHGTAFGTSVVQGRFGNARSFNGVSDYVWVNTPSNGSLDFSENESFTVSVWFKTFGEQGNMIRRGLAPAPGFMIGVSYGNIAAIIGNFNGGGTSDTLIWIVSDQKYNDGTWHHVTLVRDRVQKKIYLYIDDARAATPVEDTFTLPLISDRPLTFGRWENSAFPGYFQGTLDEIKISKSADHPASAYFPIIGTAPTSLNFGRVLVGDTLRSSIIIRNLGIHDSLDVSAITSNNGLYQPTVASTVIAPGSESVVGLLYGPTSVHVDTATITIASDDPENPFVNVHLTGQGYVPGQEPFITGIRDIPSDQGGRVRVIWSRSLYDGLKDSLKATEYNIWRRVDDLSRKAISSGHTEGEIFSASGHTMLCSNDELWDYIVRVPAVGFGQYSYVAPTLADSAPNAAVRWSVFKISAHMLSGEYFFSPADSGSSVDNLSPGTPSNVRVNQNSGIVDISWDQSVDPDVDYYAVYAGSVHNFLPDLTSMIGTTRSATYIDKNMYSASVMYYRVKALDKAGNPSGYSAEVTSSMTDIKAEESVPESFMLFQSYPNPFNPAAMIRFDMAKEELISLKIYDVLGQEVATLTNQRMLPGKYEIPWNAQGMPSGTYFVRMSAGDYVSVGKMMLLK